MALVARPQLVVLDEPTSALDPLGRADVRDLLLSLEERGVAVLLNSHLIGEVERVCDRVGGFSKGMQQRLGMAVALVARPQLVVLDEPTSARQARCSSGVAATPASGTCRASTSVAVSQGW